jgi:Fungal specific transcription factor domain
MERYERLWAPGHNGTNEANEGTDDPLFMAILYLIFAIGSQFSPFKSPEQRPALAEQFYHQSLKFWDTTIAEISTLEEIQLLLLAGVYLQSTKHASRCWHTVGMAIRGAQELGLHLENRRPGSECQLKREIRRRTWHACVTLDR